VRGHDCDPRPGTQGNHFPVAAQHEARRRSANVATQYPKERNCSKHDLPETLPLSAQPRLHPCLGEARTGGLGAWSQQTLIFKRFSNPGECSRTISLLKIRQVPKQFPGSRLHSSHVSSAGFAAALTETLVVTQKSHTTISLRLQPAAKTEHGKPQRGFYPATEVTETSDEVKALCFGAGRPAAVE